LAEELKKKITETDEVVVLDGCSLCCGQRTMKEEEGVSVHKHVITTDLEILSENLEYTKVIFNGWRGH
jgi:uncharacterized metal-binding protein